MFVDGRRAYVVGLLSILVLDISHSSSPVVLQRIRLSPGPRSMAMRSCSDCGWVDRGFDGLCDWLGGCGAFGRAAAAYDRGRLFLVVLGTLHVIDVRDGTGPDLVASAPLGSVADLVVELPFVYANRQGRRTAVLRDAGEDLWIIVGEHDVRQWVEGVVTVGDWAVRWAPGRFQIATRQ